MEKYGNSPMTNVNSKLQINNKKKFTTKIEAEYSLKKSFFDPTKKNQNIFLHNLEQRMKDYYDKLYNLRNSNTK